MHVLVYAIPNLMKFHRASISISLFCIWREFFRFFRECIRTCVRMKTGNLLFYVQFLCDISFEVLESPWTMRWWCRWEQITLNKANVQRIVNLCLWSYVCESVNAIERNYWGVKSKKKYSIYFVALLSLAICDTITSSSKCQINSCELYGISVSVYTRVSDLMAIFHIILELYVCVRLWLFHFVRMKFKFPKAENMWII